MARRLVLNGLTAEVRAGSGAGQAGAGRGGSPEEQEFYHELELYRQLLALPPPATPAPAARRARTPDPPPPLREHDTGEGRARTPAPPRAFPPNPPAPAPLPVQVRPAMLYRKDGNTYKFHGGGSRDGSKVQLSLHNLACLSTIFTCKYLGSFPVCGGEQAARADTVSRHLQLMKENGRAQPVLVVVALSGVKICRPHDQSVRMAHALRRISYATCEGARALFAFVARPPRAPHAPHAPTPDQHYCHAFATDTPQQAEELNALVGDAFRMAFASQLHPSAPLWTKELSSGGSDRGGMGVRAPDSLPGLTHHYPHCIDRSPTKCDLMGGSKLLPEASPSSSEESGSPTETTSYRRLGDKPPLMRRLAMGFSGVQLLQPSDDDSTPLVTDTPTTPTNLQLCMNGGYINEASEAEVRTRESNRESPAHRPTPTHTATANTTNTTNTRHHHDNLMHHDLDVDFKKHNNVKNCSSSAMCSRATSSSSGASSCGASSRSGNNNAPTLPALPAPHLARLEPDLKQAPWFQAGIPREIALEVLSNQPVGAFMVRCSTTQTGCFALSVRVPRDFQPCGIAHYLILRTPKGYKIKGFTKEFSSLTSLVTHHSVMPELLPCPLWLARYNPAYSRRDHADLDAMADPDYSARHDFNTFMCQLDV